MAPGAPMVLGAPMAPGAPMVLGAPMAPRAPMPPGAPGAPGVPGALGTPGALGAPTSCSYAPGGVAVTSSLPGMCAAVPLGYPQQVCGAVYGGPPNPVVIPQAAAAANCVGGPQMGVPPQWAVGQQGAPAQPPNVGPHGGPPEGTGAAGGQTQTGGPPGPSKEALQRPAQVKALW